MDMRDMKTTCDICGQKRGHIMGHKQIDHSKCSKIRQRRRIAQEILKLKNAKTVSA